MAITTYDELKAAGANWLIRGDLTARIPEFIALFEASANRKLRARKMEKRSTASPSTEYGTLPTDFKGDVSIVLSDGSSTWQLRLATQEVIDANVGSATTGRPEWYAIVGNQIRWYPAPDTTYDAIYTFHSAITPLSADDATNWLLDLAPDYYLYGLLAEAGPFLRDPGLTAAYEAKRDRAFAEIKFDQRRPVGPLRTETAAMTGSKAGYNIVSDR